jgi:hypothetical protein
MHLPIVIWMVLGLAFTGNSFKRTENRLAYLKFNGEFAILFALMAVSGMLVFGITTQLFSIIGMNISEFYFKNVVLFGAASLAVVAAYLASTELKLTRSITPYLAKIFSPILLLTLLIYSITVSMVGKNPFVDRDFLLTCNGILLFVLLISIYSITERSKAHSFTIFDYTNVSLLALALLIDSVALAAIVFRLSSYGFSPNRIVVLGFNVLIWIHLYRILLAYIQMLRTKIGPAQIQHAVASYIPIYGYWALLVTIMMSVLTFIK